MEKFIIVGLPTIAALIIFVQLARSKPSAGGSSGALGFLFMVVFWALFFGILLIVGLITWFSSGNTQFLQAFLFSTLSFVATVMLYTKVLAKKKR
ncbi:MAG: hypothetical protein GY810_00280 [Aureispira sp.]|nr:hypothetical protein [Aureispira sp.]